MTTGRSRPTPGWTSSLGRNHGLAEIMYQLVVVCRFLYIYVLSIIKGNIISSFLCLLLVSLHWKEPRGECLIKVVKIGSRGPSFGILHEVCRETSSLYKGMYLLFFHF